MLTRPPLSACRVEPCRSPPPVCLASPTAAHRRINAQSLSRNKQMRKPTSDPSFPTEAREPMGWTLISSTPSWPPFPDLAWPSRPSAGCERGIDKPRPRRGGCSMHGSWIRPAMRPCTPLRAVCPALDLGLDATMARAAFMRAGVPTSVL